MKVKDLQIGNLVNVNWGQPIEAKVVDIKIVNGDVKVTCDGVTIAFTKDFDLSDIIDII